MEIVLLQHVRFTALYKQKKVSFVELLNACSITKEV